MWCFPRLSMRHATDVQVETAQPTCSLPPRVTCVAWVYNVLCTLLSMMVQLVPLIKRYRSNLSMIKSCNIIIFVHIKIVSWNVILFHLFSFEILRIKYHITKLIFKKKESRNIGASYVTINRLKLLNWAWAKVHTSPVEVLRCDECKLVGVFQHIFLFK